MRERVWGMQGEITISADEPPGTRIDIVLPVHVDTPGVLADLLLAG